MKLTASRENLQLNVGSHLRWGIVQLTFRKCWLRHRWGNGKAWENAALHPAGFELETYMESENFTTRTPISIFLFCH